MKLTLVEGSFIPSVNMIDKGSELYTLREKMRSWADTWDIYESSGLIVNFFECEDRINIEWEFSYPYHQPI